MKGSWIPGRIMTCLVTVGVFLSLAFLADSSNCHGVIRRERTQWRQLPRVLSHADPHKADDRHAGRRRLHDSQPLDHIPPHLVVDLFNWWHQDVSVTNISARGEYGSLEDSQALQSKVQELKVTNLLDAYYVMRGTMKVPVAVGWQEASSRCPAGCTKLGTCNEELGRCDCPIGRGGPDCSAVVEVDCRRDLCYHEFDQMGTCYFFHQQHCINHCNARGACISQFCHCYPGYFGADCSLSLGPDGRPQLLAGLGYRPNLWGPKIYVYELPPPMATWRPIWVDRPVAAMLWERVLSGGWRTARHEEADYFLMPMPLRHCTAFKDVLRYLSSGADLPVNYWHRHHQRDHLMVHTGDWGRCELDMILRHKLQYDNASDGPLFNLTLLNHWGLTALRASSHGMPLGDKFRGPCHHFNQDLVVPPDNGAMRWTVGANSPWHSLGRQRDVERTRLAFFAGTICGYMSKKERPPCGIWGKVYSLGIREQLFLLFHNKSDFLLETRVEDIGLEMRRSIFCFAPLGAGWGRRGAMAVQLGCIPVVISDNVTQFWEPFIDWADFGIKVEEKDVPNLEAILRAVTPQQIADKQAKLRCVARHISWSSAWGTFDADDDGRWDAVGTIMAALAVRKRHPGVPDTQLRSVDSAFDDFMACRGATHESSTAASGTTGSTSNGGAEGSQWGSQLCSISLLYKNFQQQQAMSPDHRLCTLHLSGRVFLPGGATCDGATDLAHCIRRDPVAAANGTEAEAVSVTGTPLRRVALNATEGRVG